MSEPRPDIMAWKYRKLLMNLGNVVDAFCVPGAAADSLTDALRAEADRVLAAAGIAVIPESVDLARRGDLLRRGPSLGTEPVARPGRAWPEAPARSRPISSTARSSAWAVSHGVPTPFNARVRGLCPPGARLRRAAPVRGRGDPARLAGGGQGGE